MEQDDKKELPPFLPVLPRLDRLDRLMQLLEEKRSLSGRACSKQPEVRSSEVFQFKPISNAVEEVHHKGTLMARLEFLEKRVLQLSMDMDEGNTSRSTSSTQKLGNSSCLSSATKEVSGDDRTQDEVISATESESGSKKRKQKRKGERKWRGWFALGCT